MARRGIPEVNAGSMADIAFLLLVFFLMVTTIESEEGIYRVLPPPIDPEEIIDVKVKERDVFVVLVNMNNQLLVENEFIELNQLRGKAKEFIISNGVFGDLPQDPNLPIKSFIRKDSIQDKIAEFAGMLDEAPSEEEANEDELKFRKEVESKLTQWEIKLKVFEDFGRYKPMPAQSIISMQNDNGTNYDTYIQVQQELTAAVNELRDELALEKFGISYIQLEREFDRKKNDESLGDDLKEQVMMIREVYPMRIVEAEPKNVERY